MRLTFGTGALARSPDPRALVRRALDRGIARFELAAEDAAAVSALAGQVTPDVELSVRLTPAIPFDLPSPHVSAARAWPGARLRAEVDQLLQRTGCERIGLVMLHAWCPEWLDEGDWRETTDRLRADGKIGGIGISLFDHDVDAGLDAVDRRAIDRVQVMFNLFDTGAALNLFPLARDRGVAVVARSSLYYGMLTRPAPRAFASGDWRADFFFDQHRHETTARAAAIAAELSAGETLSDIALRFALSHPAVSSVAVGLRTPAQLDAAIAAADRGALPPDRLRALFAHRWLCLTPQSNP